MKRIAAIIAVICCLITGCQAAAPEASSESAAPQGAEPGVYGPLSESVITAMADGDYGMTLAITGGGQQAPAEAKTIRQGENYAVEVPGAGMRIIVNNGVSYVVFDGRKIYMDLSLSGLDPEAFALPDIASVLSYMGAGTGTVMNRELPYEEYGAGAGTSRYYFDGENLAYITTASDSGETVIEVKEFSDTADPALFDIPADFAQIKSLEDLNALPAA